MHFGRCVAKELFCEKRFVIPPKKRKKEPGQYPTILPEQTWSITHVSSSKNPGILCVSWSSSLGRLYRLTVVREQSSPDSARARSIRGRTGTLCMSKNSLRGITLGITPISDYPHPVACSSFNKSLNTRYFLFSLAATSSCPLGAGSDVLCLQRFCALALNTKEYSENVTVFSLWAVTPTTSRH